jgi:serine/threonine-protein kinase
MSGKSSTDERLALLGICQFQSLNAAAARLYADAFAADPGLAEQLTAECFDRAAREELTADRIEVLNAEVRFLAAGCAALAGRGLDADGTKLNPAERMRWREHAADWLRDDLAAWTKRLADGPGAGRDLITEMLTLWRSDPHLAGLREADALSSLSTKEREQWITLWKQLDDVLASASQRI